MVSCHMQKTAVVKCARCGEEGHSLKSCRDPVPVIVGGKVIGYSVWNGVDTLCRDIEIGGRPLSVEKRPADFAFHYPKTTHGGRY